MTPEGKVKAKIGRLLRSQGEHLYYHMPVQAGFGAPSLDYVGWVNGTPFAIEAKAPGKRPTDRQLSTMARMEAAGATVFFIDSDNRVQELAAWLELHT